MSKVTFGLSVAVAFLFGASLVFVLSPFKFEAALAPGILGAGAHSQSVKQAVTKTSTSLVATTSIQNADSSNRIVDKVVFYASTTAAVPTTTVSICYSSSTSGCDTALGAIGTIGGAVNTTQIKLSSTTVSTSSIWYAGQYLACYAATAATTTEGFCAVEYYNP